MKQSREALRGGKQPLCVASQGSGGGPQAYTCLSLIPTLIPGHRWTGQSLSA
jgi:hypothetical protein